MLITGAGLGPAQLLPYGHRKYTRPKLNHFGRTRDQRGLVLPPCLTQHNGVSMQEVDLGIPGWLGSQSRAIVQNILEVEVLWMILRHTPASRRHLGYHDPVSLFLLRYTYGAP